jgi:hypothetical protein
MQIFATCTEPLGFLQRPRQEHLRHLMDKRWFQQPHTGNISRTILNSRQIAWGYRSNQRSGPPAIACWHFRRPDGPPRPERRIHAACLPAGPQQPRGDGSLPQKQGRPLARCVDRPDQVQQIVSDVTAFRLLYPTDPSLNCCRASSNVERIRVENSE